MIVHNRGAVHFRINANIVKPEQTDGLWAESSDVLEPNQLNVLIQKIKNEFSVDINRFS